MRKPTDLADLIYLVSDDGLDPQRPFDGQPHTNQGERGKTHWQRAERRRTTTSMSATATLTRWPSCRT